MHPLGARPRSVVLSRTIRPRGTSALPDRDKFERSLAPFHGITGDGALGFGALSFVVPILNFVAIRELPPALARGPQHPPPAPRIADRRAAPRTPHPPSGGCGVFQTQNRAVERGMHPRTERRRSLESREPRVSPIRWRSGSPQTRARIPDDGRTTGATGHSDRAAVDRPSQTPSSLLAMPASSVMRIESCATACRSWRSMALTPMREVMTANIAGAGWAHKSLMIQVGHRPTSLARA